MAIRVTTSSRCRDGKVSGAEGGYVDTESKTPTLPEARMMLCHAIISRLGMLGLRLEICARPAGETCG